MHNIYFSQVIKIVHLPTHTICGFTLGVVKFRISFVKLKKLYKNLRCSKMNCVVSRNAFFCIFVASESHTMGAFLKCLNRNAYRVIPRLKAFSKETFLCHSELAHARCYKMAANHCLFQIW